MENTELSFTRRKLRRELQETLNELDTAASTEEEYKRQGHDLLACMRLILMATAVQEYITATKNETKETTANAERQEEE